MPSLQTSSKNSKKIPSTYDFFYLQIVGKNGMQNDTDTSLLWAFVHCLLSFIVIMQTVYIIRFSLWDFIYYRLNDIYRSNDLFYGKASILMLVEFIGTTCLVFTFFNQHSRNSLSKIGLICFIINVLILGGIAFYLCIKFHSSTEYVDPNSLNICSIGHTYSGLSPLLCQSDTNYSIMKSEDCRCHFSFSFIYIYCIYPCISLLFVVIVNFVWFNNEKPSQRRQYLLSLDEKSTISIPIVANMLAMENQVQNINSVNNIDNDNDDNAGTSEESVMIMGKESLWLTPSQSRTIVFSVAYCFLWFLFLSMIWILNDINFSEKNKSYYFYILNVTCTCFKWPLKRIGRKIDILTQASLEALNANHFQRYACVSVISVINHMFAFDFLLFLIECFVN